MELFEPRKHERTKYTKRKDKGHEGVSFTAKGRKGVLGVFGAKWEREGAEGLPPRPTIPAQDGRARTGWQPVLQLALHSWGNGRAAAARQMRVRGVEWKCPGSRRIERWHILCYRGIIYEQHLDEVHYAMGAGGPPCRDMM